MSVNYDAIKQRAVRTIERLALADTWTYDASRLAAWEPGVHTRSLYLPVTLKSQDEAFVKYPITPKSRQTLKREMVYMQFVGQRYPELVPKIYAYNEGRFPWILREYANPPRQLSVKAEETQMLERHHIRWICDGLEKISDLAAPRLPQRLWHHRYERTIGETFDTYVRRVLYYYRQIRRRPLLAAAGFPFELIDQFITDIQAHPPDLAENRTWLFHGDFAPNNLIFDLTREQIIILDWEWAFVTRARTIHGAADIGTMTMRLWKNQPIQAYFLEEIVRRKLATNLEIQLAVLIETVGHLYSLSEQDYTAESPTQVTRHARAISRLLLKLFS